ncbi:uncharacterized protein UBRO_04636 [Ustilago bromivora]|uniref:J domain-containing protein n=1 Tax=Ustilago bromivora TaxID=307758 RepID=A0A1K0G4L8_9BASI|nr:uncharacterized protein UBRO_04636 [Ustilago bromivora]SYW79412.1 uncharacterized protein UBRO2_03096 [Ustilago bromivora]
MPPPARATIEDFRDEDDPYAPYRPGQSSRRSRSASSQSNNSSDLSSSSTASSNSTGCTSHTSTSPNQHQRSELYDNPSSSASSSRPQAPPAEEEPLFGGTPFRDAHDPSSSTSATAPSSPDKEHLYTILNIPSDASTDAIKEAYRSLAVVLHPDKHSDPSRKSAAESRFREVQRAYEILSDPEKRTIYDYFGEEGLESTWSVAVRGRSREEMAAEFERERRRKQAADAEGLVKSKGDFTAHIDASSLFAHPSRIPRRPPARGLGGKEVVAPAPQAGLVAGFPRTVTLAERVNRVGCTQLVGKHGFETQVTNTTSATFSGQMVSRNGLGSGNLVGTLKTHWSPRLFTDITLAFLRPQIVTTKGQYTVDANSFFSWQGTLQTLMLPPTLNLTYAQRLSAKSTLTGFTSVRSGTYALGPWGGKVLDGSAGVMVRREPAAVSVGLTKQEGDEKGWTSQLSISPVDQNISVDYGMKVLGGVKLRTGLNIGTGSGISAFTNAERRLTENVRLSLGLNCALPVGGVSLRVKVNRLGQKILVPITLSPEFRSDLVVLGSVVPAAAYTALHYGYLEPRKQRRLQNRLGELRAQNQELILERRQAALEALAVLRDQAVKKATLELRKSGLVIVEAWYGRKEAFPSPRFSPTTFSLDDAEHLWEQEKMNPTQPAAEGVDLEKETSWDVRVPLQALVNKGQLIIPGGRSKANLLGFHDPVMGEKKWLSVTYAFRGQLHQTVVEDWGEIACPMRIHQLT